MEGIKTLKDPVVPLSRPSTAPRSVNARQGPAPSEGGTRATAVDRDQEVSGSLRRRIDELAQQVDDRLRNIDEQYSVSVDDESGFIIVRITDADTGEVVKQIPPQQILDANISVDKIIGLLVNEKA